MTADKQNLTDKIKAEALRLGFSACGIAEAAMVADDEWIRLTRWIHDGMNAGMQYMENYPILRHDLREFMPGSRSVISLALNYYPQQCIADDRYQFAYYAYGQDYHIVMKKKMQQLAEYIRSLLTPPEDFSYRLAVDSAPVLERYWAWKAGLGWIGRNHNLIIPGKGSFFFLSEIITDMELAYDSPIGTGCGSCRRCIEACPGQALLETGAETVLDARKCHSYLTIEDKSTEPRVSKEQSCGYIYGCDVCQRVCPHNRHSIPTSIAEFVPKESFLEMTDADWHRLTKEQFSTLFKGTAVKRVKFEKLCSNISVQQS